MTPWMSNYVLQRSARGFGKGAAGAPEYRGACGPRLGYTAARSTQTLGVTLRVCSHHLVEN